MLIVIILIFQLLDNLLEECLLLVQEHPRKHLLHLQVSHDPSSM